MSVLEKTERSGGLVLIPVRQIWNWLKWPLAAVLLALVYHYNAKAFDEFAAKPKNWGYLGTAFVLISFATVLVIVRWHLLVSSLGIPFRMRDAFRLGFAALFLNYVGPGLVGGDLFKAFFIAKEQRGRRAEAAATVLLDRIVGLIPLLILGTIASLCLSGFPGSFLNTTVKLTLWIGSAGGILGLYVLLQPWFTRSIWVRGLGRFPYVGKTFIDILNGVALYQSRPRVLVFAILMGFVGHIATICGFYYGALGAGVWAPSLAEHMYFMPVAEVIGMIPSPVAGGIGPLELAVTEAYGFAAGDAVEPAIAKGAGLFATLAFRVISVLIAAVGGVYYISARKEFGAAMAEVSPSA